MDRNERLARNESVFREVNERIEELAKSGDFGEFDSLEILCECGNADCQEPLRLSVADYERVRQEPTDFFVAPGHAIPAIEKVVDSRQNFEVVRKLEEERDLARKTDPRS
jgi:hypothetical protein